MGKTRRYFYIEDDLYQEFKALSNLSGVTMTEVINESIKEYNKVIRMLVDGMSAGELLDFSHYKLYKAKKEIDALPDGRNTRVTDKV